jgi:hypothetical protein
MSRKRKNIGETTMSLRKGKKGDGFEPRKLLPTHIDVHAHVKYV